MNANSLIRLSGWATIIGGIGFALGDFLRPLLFPESQTLSERYSRPGLVLLDALQLALMVLFLLSLFGIYVQQRQASGRMGFVGFVLAFSGTTLAIANRWPMAFLFSSLAGADPTFLNSLSTNPPTLTTFGILLGFVLFVTGWIAFSLAALRAKVYPRGASLLILVGVILLFPAPIPANFLLGCGWVWMGYRALRAPVIDISAQSPSDG